MIAMACCLNIASIAEGMKLNSNTTFYARMAVKRVKDNYLANLCQRVTSKRF